MKQILTFAIAAALFVGTTSAQAEEIKSGLQAGDSIGAFDVTKCAGASEDGVEVGKNLCYRCKNGRRPQVMVFTRSSDNKVVDLVKQLDQQIAQNTEKQLRGFVNYLSENKSEAMDQVKDLAAKSKAENVPFVVPNEFENGPEDYGLNSKAAVTVIVAKEGQVVANYAVASPSELKVDAIIADVNKMLN